MTQRCGNCRFFLRDNDDPKTGSCRLLPRSIFRFEGSDKVVGLFAPAVIDSWCGKWKRLRLLDLIRRGRTS